MLGVKPYDEISVTDICDHANVGRSAFYQHFSCKDDLFRKGFSRLSDDLVTALNEAPFSKPNEKLTTLAEGLLRHGQAHARIYRATTSGHAGTMTAKVMTDLLSPMVANILDSSPEPDNVTLRLKAAVIVSALLGAMHWWLQRGGKMKLVTVMATIQPLLNSFVSSSR
nr:TetR/AcrR family transcriptional regulator [Asticcacaulis solisilvae]